MNMTQPFNPSLFLPKREQSPRAPNVATSEEPNFFNQVGEKIDNLLSPKPSVRKAPEQESKPDENVLDAIGREWDEMVAKVGNIFQPSPPPPPEPEPEPEPEPDGLLDQIGKFFEGLGPQEQPSPPAAAPPSPPAAAAKRPRDPDVWHPGKYIEKARRRSACRSGCARPRGPAPPLPCSRGPRLSCPHQSRACSPCALLLA